MKKILSIAGAILTLTALIGGAFALNDYVAKDSDLKLVSMRLDEKIIKDRMNTLQERIWQLQTYYRQYPPMPVEVEKEIIMLQLEIEELKAELENK
jgi:hypothetical protein